MRGFTKVRALLKDFENDSAFDVSAFDVNSRTSKEISEIYLAEDKNRISALTGDQNSSNVFKTGINAASAQKLK